MASPSHPPTAERGSLNHSTANQPLPAGREGKNKLEAQEDACWRRLRSSAIWNRRSLVKTRWLMA